MNQSINTTTIRGVAEQSLDFERYTFTQAAEFVNRHKISFDEAFKYALVQYTSQELENSGVLNRPRIVTQTRTPQFEKSYSSSVGVAEKQGPNHDLSPGNIAIVNVQKAVKIPGNDKKLFQAIYTMASRTTDECAFEEYPDHTLNFLTAIKKVGPETAISETIKNNPLSPKSTIATILNVQIFATNNRSHTL